MQKLIERNYKTIVDRGLIDTETTIVEQARAVRIEYDEFSNAFHDCLLNNSNYNQLHLAEEVGDFILAGLNLLKMMGLDPEQILINDIEKNEHRAEVGK